MKKKVLVSIVSLVATALSSIIKTNFKIYSSFFRFNNNNYFVNHFINSYAYNYQCGINYVKINS